MKSSLLVTTAIIFILTACGGEGKRTKITKPSKGDKKPAISIKAITNSNKDANGKPGNRECLDLGKTIDQIRSKKQMSLRVYTSDLRVLESTRFDSDLDVLKNPKWAQNNLVIESIKSDNHPFYVVDYAKDVIKDVPSKLAPFEIKKDAQDQCLTVDIKFKRNDESKQKTISYKILDTDGNKYTENRIVLLSPDKDEMYIFNMFNQNRLNVVMYKGITERTKCKKQNSEENFLTRTILTYEWAYKSDQKLLMSTVLASTFSDILNTKKKNSTDPDPIGIPIDIENELKTNPNTASNRIQITNDDYQKMIQDVRSDEITAECRK